jgi:hypothetical protein
VADVHDPDVDIEHVAGKGIISPVFSPSIQTFERSSISIVMETPGWTPFPERPLTAPTTVVPPKTRSPRLFFPALTKTLPQGTEVTDNC